MTYAKELRSVGIRAVDLIVAYEQQETYSCGPASLYVAYKALGKDIPESQIIAETGCDKDGTEWKQMTENPYLHGFTVWTGHNSDYKTLVRIYNQTGFPIIVPWYDDVNEGEPDDHYSVIKRINGYGLVLADPANGGYTALMKQQFDKKWEKNDRDFMVVVGHH